MCTVILIIIIHTGDKYKSCILNSNTQTTRITNPTDVKKISDILTNPNNQKVTEQNRNDQHITITLCTDEQGTQKHLINYIYENDVCLYEPVPTGTESNNETYQQLPSGTYKYLMNLLNNTTTQ